MTNWTRVILGAGIFTVGLAEPTPLAEIVGLAFIASGLGVKVPILGAS